MSDVNDAIQKLRTVNDAIQRLQAAEQVVNEQLDDEGLWFVATSAPEAYLQQELRRLHEAIDGRTKEECARKAKCHHYSWDDREDRRGMYDEYLPSDRAVLSECHYLIENYNYGKFWHHEDEKRAWEEAQAALVIFKYIRMPDTPIPVLSDRKRVEAKEESSEAIPPNQYPYHVEMVSLTTDTDGMVYGLDTEGGVWILQFGGKQFPTHWKRVPPDFRYE